MKLPPPPGEPYMHSIENTFPHVNQRIYELVQAANDANRRIENLEHMVRFLAAHYDGGKPPVEGLAETQVNYLDATLGAAELRSRDRRLIRDDSPPKKEDHG